MSAQPPHALLEQLVLDPTAYVAPGAAVVGRVTLGARASVWYSAVIRADMDRAVLGEESNLQDGAVIHVDHGFPTTVGRRVTIGHRAIVHAATVEDGCLIGMGAIVLTGAVVGTGSLVAAGALVREGQVIPPGSLVVGAPARVLGPVKPRFECDPPTWVVRAGLFDEASHKARMDAIAPLHALGRVGTEEEIAEAVEYLIRAEWTTGASLVVDGGLSLGVSNF